MPDSDLLYHQLFSIPYMVELLVREFVPEALATRPDFSQLQRVNTKFHAGWRSARRREGDIIWRLPIREGAGIWLYLLIEFQSRIDWRMTVRTQVYQGLLWQQVIEEKKLKEGALLPPLPLLVLYNGTPLWEAATKTRELIALSPDSTLWRWQPQVRYHLLDMGAFSGNDLKRRRSLAALLFRLERRPESEQIKKLIGEACSWFRRHPDQERLKSLFGELVRQFFARFGKRLPSNDLLEMEAMMKSNFESNFVTTADRWKKRYLTEGRVKGRLEGKAEGRAEGKADALVCLLVARFGALAPSLRKRINGAKLATLDRWYKRAIVASDLPSVFDGSR